MNTQNESFPSAPDDAEKPYQFMVPRPAPDADAPILKPPTGGYIGDGVDVLTEKFLQENKEALAAFKGVEIDRKATTKQFQWFEAELKKSAEGVARFEQVVRSYQSQGTDLALTLYKNVFDGSFRVDQIAADPFVQSCLLCQQFGDKAIELAKANHAALQKRFADFKHNKRALLQELKLI